MTSPATEPRLGANSGLPLAARTCLRRLEAAGATAHQVPGPDRADAATIVAQARSPELNQTVGATISSFGPAAGLLPAGPGGEAVVQALSGLMAVHGSDQGRPERLGLEVASVAAGILATHGVLATLVGQARGGAARETHTSLLQAALLVSSHYVAAATGADSPWPAGAEPEPGPPFSSADGCWFEIETLDPEAWRSFWGHLGVPADVLGRAWTRFRARYFSGTSSLPPGLHAATARHPMAELAAVAAGYRVSLCPLRDYPPVLADLDGWRGTPSVQPLSAGGALPAQPSKPAAGEAGDLPLAGLLVVEATTRMQGPLAGLLLALLGARVVKVEPPGGDIGRGMAPLAGDTGSFFLCFNRGKQTVELDLAASTGRAELVDLVSGADVFLHNWRPGRDRQWSLRAEDLARRNPGLVYAEASGWGGQPGLDHVLGTDFLVQAFAGLGYGLTPEGQPPRTSRVTLTDHLGALVTCEGILAGLYQRCSDGLGRRVGTSLWAGGVSLQAHVLDDMDTGRESPRRGGRPMWDLLDRPIETADGTLVVSIGDEGDLGRLAEACGLDGGPGQPDLQRQITDRLAAGDAADWVDRLGRTGAGCAQARTDLAALPDDPALGGLFEPLGGGCAAAASPWSFAR